MCNAVARTLHKRQNFGKLNQDWGQNFCNSHCLSNHRI